MESVSMTCHVTQELDAAKRLAAQLPPGPKMVHFSDPIDEIVKVTVVLEDKKGH